MKKSRLRTLFIGLLGGVAYSFLTMLIVSENHNNISISYVFILPIIMGAIPVLFSTKEQLKSYYSFILLPWLIVILFYTLSLVLKFEGMICLVIIITPFLLLGSLGAFIFRLIKLKSKGNGSKLYFSLFIPFIVLIAENNITPSSQINEISTSIKIYAPSPKIWENIKNVKNINHNEINTHFIHFMGFPKPIDGRLDKEGINGVRHITWEKGIKFKEKITEWNNNESFSYDISVDPSTIPPESLDEHVIIGGRYFDLIDGSYTIKDSNNSEKTVTLTCKYRITSNINFYSKWWADFILNDFNEMILEVIKNRCEKKTITNNN